MSRSREDILKGCFITKSSKDLRRKLGTTKNLITVRVSSELYSPTPTTALRLLHDT